MPKEYMGTQVDRVDQRQTILTIGRLIKLIERQHNTTKAKFLLEWEPKDTVDIERLETMLRSCKDILLTYKDYVLYDDEKKRPA
jgi:hypothetical protein